MPQDDSEPLHHLRAYDAYARSPSTSSGKVCSGRATEQTAIPACLTPGLPVFAPHQVQALLLIPPRLKESASLGDTPRRFPVALEQACEAVEYLSMHRAATHAARNIARHGADTPDIHLAFS